MTDARKVEILEQAESEFKQNVGGCRSRFKTSRDYVLARFKQLAGTTLTEAVANVRKPARPVSQGAFGSGYEESESSGGAVAAFNAAVEKTMDRPGFRGDRRAAITSVMKSQPQLHREYLEALNPGKRSRELIADRFANC